MHRWRPRLVLLTLVLPLLLVSAHREAAAQEAEARPLTREDINFALLAKDRKEKAMKYPPARRIQRYIAAAAEAVDEDDPEEARRLLMKLNPKRLNPYERALVYRMLAYVAYGAEQPAEAIKYFKLFLEEEMLPISEEARVRYYIAQLYAALEEWQQVIDWLDEWLLYVNEPDPLGYYLMGMAYFQLEDFDKAIEKTTLAIELKPNPRESWLRLLAALYSQNKDYPNAAKVLEELVLRFPKKQYWVQLALIFGAIENYERALAVQQVAYEQGFLTDDKELMRLARSYLYHDLPYPAAKVLEKGLKDGYIEADGDAYELLANAWIAAREYDRSLPPLEKAAALSKDGNLYIRLGQVQMQRENWDAASTYFEKAVEKGGIKNPGNAELLRGIAYYNRNQPAKARSSFMRAQDHEDTREAAAGWIIHLDNEAGGGEESAG